MTIPYWVCYMDCLNYDNSLLGMLFSQIPKKAMKSGCFSWPAATVILCLYVHDTKRISPNPRYRYVRF